jgi:hypothetical protein
MVGSCACALGAAASIAAQQPSAATTHTIRGTVYDSVAAKPLAGAVVQIAANDAATAPATATTDSLGHYRISGVPSGRFVVGFYHDALTTLGLDAPTQGIELAGDTLVTVNLAIPSSATVRAIRCGESSPFAPGMLVGFVRDAESRGAMPDAKVTVQWGAIALDPGNLRTVREQVTAAIEDDGSFVACRLPLNAVLDVAVTAPGHRVLNGPVVNVPASGIARLYVLLSDSVARTGSAIVRGRVLRESGKAVGAGLVVIAALGRAVPVQDGSFVVGNLPTGSWIAEARVMGVEPQTELVTATDSAVASTTFRVSDHPQRMDAVTVMGKPDRNLSVLDDVLRRSRIGSGTTFLPGNPALRNALWTSDVLKEARGFRYISPDSSVGRGGCANVAVYVNNMRQPDGLRGLDLVAPVNEVLAVETWPSIEFAPVQYRPSPLGRLSEGPGEGLAHIGSSPTPSACALVLIWTRRAF